MIVGASLATASSVMYNSSPDAFPKIAKISKYELANCTDPASPIYDPAVLKAYGKVPDIQNASHLNEFTSKLRNIRDESWDETNFYPNGSVIQYGSSPTRGYFWIELYDDGRKEITYSQIYLNEIYSIVERYALENGIEDVPVVFTLTNQTSMIGFTEFPFYFYDIDNETKKEIHKPKQEQKTYETRNQTLLDSKIGSKQTPALGIWESLSMIFGVILIQIKKIQ
ncbi:hypothetical protein V7O62_10090 [Methanolobus sp. ZRKC2]|uniref:hypothetical protein n=1 Tax=Methanolobus sp. ZRKC2 TaxID=3125783 RepID=UPI0032525E6B